MSETIKVVRSYLDQNFDVQQVTEESSWDAYPDKESAIAAIPPDVLLSVLNAGARELRKTELGRVAEGKFPADAVSEEAYNAVFDAFRPRLEATGISGIKELRAAFRERAKGNPKIAAQVRAMSEALAITL